MNLQSSGPPRRRGRLAAARIAFVIALAGWPLAAAAEQAPTEVLDLTLGRPITLLSLRAAHAVVVDDSICRARVEGSTLELAGLKRGETILLVWRKGDDLPPLTFLVRVSAPPSPPAEKALTTEERDAIGYGAVGSLVHIGLTPSGGKSATLLTPFSWTQG